MILKQKPRPKNLTNLSWLETSRINMEGLTLTIFCLIFYSHLVHAMYRSNGAIWSSRCVPPRGTAYHHRIGLTLGATTPTSSSSSSSAAWGAGAAIAFSRATWMKFQSLMLQSLLQVVLEWVNTFSPGLWSTRAWQFCEQFVTFCWDGEKRENFQEI